MQRKYSISLLAVFGFAVIAVALYGAQVIGYLDLQRISAPGSPGTGFFRTYADSGSSVVKCKQPSGAACTFDSGASSLTLQTNGTPNGSQTLLNLAAGTGMGIVDNGMGTLTFTPSGSALTLETNGTSNGSQTLLNLASGSGISLADNGTGTVTITSTGGGSTGHALGMAFGISGGVALTSGQTQYVTVPFACTIAGWNLTVDAGTATVGVWKKAAGPADWHGGTGTVNTSGTAVTWVSGITFPADSVGLTITINSVVYVIASRASSTSITLASSAGTQTGVASASPGIVVPTAADSITSGGNPSISSGTFAGDTVAGGGLSGWNLSVVKNDVFGFNISSVSGVSALSIVLECN
jgi:hypothetical protein